MHLTRTRQAQIFLLSLKAINEMKIIPKIILLYSYLRFAIACMHDGFKGI